GAVDDYLFSFHDIVVVQRILIAANKITLMHSSHIHRNAGYSPASCFNKIRCEFVGILIVVDLLPRTRWHQRRRLQHDNRFVKLYKFVKTFMFLMVGRCNQYAINILMSEPLWNVAPHLGFV